MRGLLIGGSSLEPQPKLTRALVRTLQSDVNLGIFGGFGVAALMFTSWWLFIIGLLACVTYTTATLTVPKLRHRLHNGMQIRKLHDCEDVDDPVLLHLVKAFQAGRDDIETLLSRMPRELKTSLTTTQSTLDELEHCAVQLVLRAQELTLSLKLVNQNPPSDEISRLHELLQHAATVEAKRDYQAVQDLQHERQWISDEVFQTRERVLAGLMRAVAIIRALPWRLISLRVLSGQFADTVSADLNDAWAKIQGELQSSEQTLTALQGLVPPE